VSNSFPFGRATIIGGGGAVAALFARTLRACGTRELTLVDVRAIAECGVDCVQIQDDVRQPRAATQRAIASSDLVILALPETVAEAVAGQIAAGMKHDALLVETLSVKHGFASTVTTMAPGPEVLGVNPMFAPGLGFAERSVVAVLYRDGVSTSAFLDIIRSQRALVVPMDADGHDRACAVLQAATHAAILTFGMALRALRYDLPALERLMPPPHRTLLALLARVLSADPEVYRDIQAANPHAAAVREQLFRSLQEFDSLAAGGDAAAFRALFADLRGMLARSDVDYAQLCARLFQVR
jgi:prephenate dehydrogenase